MPLRNGQVVSFYPSGLVDSVNETSAFPGACQALQNVVFDRLNRGAVVARPGVTQQTNFPVASGKFSAGYVSVMISVGSRIYGMAPSFDFNLNEIPFCYDTATSSFVSITGIASDNVPTKMGGLLSPSYLPTMDVVGTKILVTHPGFTNAGSFFGWIDLSGTQLTSTGTVANGAFSMTAMTSTAGLYNGMTITGTDIPAGTTVDVVTSASSITMTKAATGANTGTYTFTGGTPAAPSWGAGNTATNGLPTKPRWVAQFFNRAYFGCGNAVFFTDSLNALNISNTNFASVLTLGDTSSTTGASGLAFSTSSAGILSSLAVFKTNSIYQISGDITGSGSTALSLNIISENIGCAAPRTAVSTPDGIYFMATDGPRLIDLTGQLDFIKRADSISPDVVSPFTNCTNPMTACASYTNGVYRICLDTYASGQSLSGADYWYDSLFGRWNGPHTFSYSSAVAIGGLFYLSGRDPNTPMLFRSEVVASSTTVYNDSAILGGSSPYTCAVQSDDQIIPTDMSETAVVESTIEVGNVDNSAGTYTVIAADDSGFVIGQASVSAPFSAPYPHIITFPGGVGGFSTLVTPSKAVAVPWLQPLVFKKMMLLVIGTSSRGFSLRETKLRFQKLGYVTA